MLKNIKLFSTDSDRTTYESSASYETPYVSKVAADNSVHYNKQVHLINFTINNLSEGVDVLESYQALEGMTWGEWIDSEYNTGELQLMPGRDVIYIGKPMQEYLIYDNNDTLIVTTDEIIENYNYKGDTSF